MSNRKKLALILAALGALALAAAFVFRLPAEAAGRLEPVSADRPDFGSDPVVVAADERIFTLFAALNAAGFDREFDGLPMSPLRQQVRTALAAKHLPSLERLRPIFDRVADYHLVVWALQRGGGPDFGRAEPGWWVSAPAAQFDGLAGALQAFYSEAGIPALWRQVEPEYRAEIARWQPLAEQSAAGIRAYLRVEGFPFRQLVVIPNPLDSYYSGNGPQIGDTAYVVAGPTETDLSLRGLIEHEALHSVIGPMLDKHIGVIPSARANRLYAVLKQTMPAGYGTWDSALEETLNRTLNLRMVADEALRARGLERLEAQGFLLARPLDRALQDYETSGQPFADYLPRLLESLNEVDLSAPLNSP
jgi:hypothetical protein